MHIKPGSEQTLDLNNHNISMMLLPNAAIWKKHQWKTRTAKSNWDNYPPPPILSESIFFNWKKQFFFKLVHLCCKHQLDRILTILVRNCFPIVFSFIGCVQLFPLWESSVADIIKSSIKTLWGRGGGQVVSSGTVGSRRGGSCLSADSLLRITCRSKRYLVSENEWNWGKKSKARLTGKYEA